MIKLKYNTKLFDIFSIGLICIKNCLICARFYVNETSCKRVQLEIKLWKHCNDVERRLHHQEVSRWVTYHVFEPFFSVFPFDPLETIRKPLVQTSAIQLVYNNSKRLVVKYFRRKAPSQIFRKSSSLSISTKKNANCDRFLQ